MLAVYESIFDAPQGELPLPESGEKFVGHHMVTVVGWTEGMASLGYINSWGPAWGADGFGHVTKEYVDRHLAEAWIVRLGDHVFSLPEAFEPFDPNLTTGDFARAWRRPPSDQGIDIGGGRRLRWYKVPSLSTKAWTLVADVVDHKRVRLGWCHVEIGRADDAWLADITELYVWPAFRRSGVGHRLFEWARGEALSAGCESFRILVFHADLDSEHVIPRERLAVDRSLEWINPSTAGMMGVGAIAGEWL
jgi:GNAT superfamily N-acetyltransferase